MTVRPFTHHVFDLRLARTRHTLRTHRQRGLQARCNEIHRQHTRTGGFEQTGRQQADEPLAHHHHAISQPHFGLPHRLHRDRCQRRVGRLPVLHAFGNECRQQIRNRDHLRMKRALRTAAGHAITHAETRVQLIHRHHHTRRRVTQRCRRFEPVAHLFQRRLPAQRLCRVDHLFDLIRPRLRLLQQRHPRLLHLHPLRSRRDHRARRPHQDSSRRRHRRRHFLEFKTSVLVLSELFHEGM